MKRSEYMSQLNEALEIFGDDVKSEIIEDYEEHYEIGLQNGKTEDQISEELGDIDELVKELKKSEFIDSKKSEKITLEKVNGKDISEVNKTKVKDNNTNQTNPVQSDMYQANTSQSDSNQTYNNENNTNTTSTAENDISSDSFTKEDKKDQGNLPRKIVLRSKFAQVEVTNSMDNQIHLDWVNYQQSKAKDFCEFRSWMEGDIIYGEIVKKNFAGLWVIMVNEDIQIKVQVPKGFPEVEVVSLSGNTVMHDVELQSACIRSASGDIQVDRCNSCQVSLDTKSGEVISKQSQIANLYMNTKSGKITFFNLQSAMIHAHTLSGEVRGDNLSGDCSISTASGDVEFASAQGKNFDLYTLSGDLELKHVQGEILKVDTKSGDIDAEVCVGNCSISSISGDLDIMNAREGSFQLSSVSGDVEFACSQIAGYVADVHTISGKTTCSYGSQMDRKLGNGIYTYGAGTSRIKAKTTSGDISLRA